MLPSADLCFAFIVDRRHIAEIAGWLLAVLEVATLEKLKHVDESLRKHGKVTLRL